MPPFTPLPYTLSETIRHRKSQYCRFADTHDWPSFTSLFSPDLEAKFTGPDGEVPVTENGVTYSFSSRDEFVAFFSGAFETQQTIHLVGPGELEQVAEDEIRAVWSLVYFSASPGAVGGWIGNGGGHYHETWKRGEDGEWVIQKLKMVRAFWKVQVLGEA
ncbi:hypothetical protein BJX61DRAFT_541626 [Aspergillus egyptiacus]|nr:hypothetical protein BJX61DRAFT_541626 [Aspergillus egyptiacus]